MNIAVLDSQGNKQKAIKVSDVMFSKPYNESLVHQVVTAYLSNARSATKTLKNRADVRGGGKKPWSQKGSGRARAGTSRGPIWRGGGATFATRSNYQQKVNKKMYQGAIVSIFAELHRQDRLLVLDKIDFETSKTKEAVGFLKNIKRDDVLIISEDITENLYLSTRNLYHVGLCEVGNIDPVSLIGYQSVVITQTALQKIMGAL